MRVSLRRFSVGIAIGTLAALIPAGAHGATTPQAALGLFSYPCSSNSAVGNFRGIAGEHDLVVGAPGDSLGGKTAIDDSSAQGAAVAGSLDVIYSTAGLDPVNNSQFISERTPGLTRSTIRPSDGDAFGYSLTTGDFNGDHRDDLAVGIPGKNSGAGAVVVIYGGAGGLVPASAQLLQMGSNGILGSPQAGAEFGYALAAGDFNKDGVKDLAIGAPRYDGGKLRDVGTVNIIYGKLGTGLQAAGNQWINQGSSSATNPEGPKAEPDDRFGASLAAGQLSDGNSAEDLAIGAPGEDAGKVADNGSVEIVHGIAGRGLSQKSEVFLYPGGPGMKLVSPQSGMDFGCSLAVGDFNGDHLLGAGAGADQDLAVGAPGLNVGGQPAAGGLFAIYNTGTPTGVTGQNPGHIRPESFWHTPDLFSEDSPGVPGVPSKAAHFGATLAAADFTGDSAQDVAVGEPTQTVYGKANAGSVRVLSGANGIGLSDANPVAFAQSPPPLANMCLLYNTPLGAGCSLTLGGPADYSPLWMVAETDDLFGSSLAGADFNNDGKADLAIGVPGEDYGEFANYITEEKGEISPTILQDNGIPISLSIDEQKDAGIVQVVNGPFPAPTAAPSAQQIIVRQGQDSLPGGLGETIRTQILYKLPLQLFVDDQIPSTTGAGTDITGDAFGSSQG